MFHCKLFNNAAKWTENGKSDIKQQHGIAIWKWTKQYFMHDKSGKIVAILSCCLFPCICRVTLLAKQTMGVIQENYSGGKSSENIDIIPMSWAKSIFNTFSNFTCIFRLKLGNFSIFPVPDGAYNPLQFAPQFVAMHVNLNQFFQSGRCTCRRCVRFHIPDPPAICNNLPTSFGLYFHFLIPTSGLTSTLNGSAVNWKRSAMQTV